MIKNILFKHTIKYVKEKNIFFLLNFIIGCLLNCTIFFYTDLFLSLFINFFVNFIKELYPDNANLIFMISTLNELYNFELIIFCVFFFFKFIYILFFIFLLFSKNLLFKHEFDFILLSFFFVFIYFFLFFLCLFFPFCRFLFTDQSTYIYNLIKLNDIKLNFSINVINEISTIQIYILNFTIIIFISKKYLLFFFVFSPFTFFPYILIIYFLSTYKSLNRYINRKSGI